MVEKDNRAESWHERRKLTWDLAGLDQSEREKGSMLLGGSAAEFVGPEDTFEYNQVNTVVFEWGDPIAETAFNVLLEHDDRPSPKYFPFNASTILDEQVWSLAVQEREFEPHLAYSSSARYIELPYERQSAVAKLRTFLSITPPRPELLGKVGPRWVTFGVGTNIR